MIYAYIHYGNFHGWKQITYSDYCRIRTIYQDKEVSNILLGVTAVIKKKANV